MADPEQFELRRGPGFNLLAQPAFLLSVISSFFTQNKAGRGPPLDALGPQDPSDAKFQNGPPFWISLGHLCNSTNYLCFIFRTEV